MLLLLSQGCATTTLVTKECLFLKPIMVSKKDVLTPGTVDQILYTNDMYEEICARRSPKELDVKDDN